MCGRVAAVRDRAAHQLLPVRIQQTHGEQQEPTDNKRNHGQSEGGCRGSFRAALSLQHLVGLGGGLGGARWGGCRG